MAHQNIRILYKFPDLIFKSTKLEYNFELKNNDLFEQIFGKYYFLILFKNNATTTGNDFWYLGEPFYRKYTFSINLDAKTIGFYLNKDVNGKKSNNTKNNDKINSTDDDDVKENNTNDNKSTNKILKYTLEIIVVIIIAVLAYYIGVIVSQKRKKRANELKDENYEYMPEENKIINDS